MSRPDSGADIEAEDRRFLTFQVADRVFAAAAEAIAEIIWIPAVARVPHAPLALLGLANLRGSVLPLVSLRALLGWEEVADIATARAIVWNGETPVGLVVDRVDGLISVKSERIQRDAELIAEVGEPLLGAFAHGGEGGAANVLDVAALLARAFASRARAPRQAVARGVEAPVERETIRRSETLVTFDVAGQEFAIEIAAVQEIVALPERIAAAPRAEAAIVGMIASRERLLPLLSLRALLGFPPLSRADRADRREKILVVAVKGARIGLIADGARAVVTADAQAIDPTPPLFAARAGGETQIKAVYRAERGRRLISILSLDQLFREDVMRRLGAERDEATPEDADARPELKFLVFRLGDGEFALPVEAVEEVARVPDRITRVPKTPAFLEGVVNLRGDALPVVDQRRRFDMPARGADEGLRLIVARAARHRAGLIVDSVSRVIGVRADAIQAAPDLAGDITRVARGVINLEAEGRIVLVLDPDALLTDAESGLLDALANSASPPS
jgi:purine-binding chemotaxis protein CheW